MKNTINIIAGIDEAGRGPVLGPMGLAITGCEQKIIPILNKAGVKDSKQIPSRKRIQLSRLIRRSCYHAFTRIPPQKIDSAVKGDHTSITTLEAKESAKLIVRLHKKLSSKEQISTIYIDLPSKNDQSYIALIRSFLPKSLQEVHIIAEHKADENYIPVSSASILAKIARDSAIRSFEKNQDVMVGSGYPSDPVTKKALRQHLSLFEKEKFVRTSWKTVHNLKREQEQTSISEY
ncbi:MAG: ribonuclease HII [Nanobdellota archaeon]